MIYKLYSLRKNNLKSFIFVILVKEKKFQQSTLCAPLFFVLVSKGCYPQYQKIKAFCTESRTRIQITGCVVPVFWSWMPQKKELISFGNESLSAT